MRRLATTVGLLALGGCGVFPSFVGEEEPREATLAELAPVELEEGARPVPELALGDLKLVYGEVLAVANDPETRLEVRQRLAGLEMLDSEMKASGDSPGREDFSATIAAYEALLRDYPDSDSADQLLYQLAKAHDLNGHSARSMALMEDLSEAHPGSAHYPEAEFRKGEAYFAASDYRSAQLAYGRVAEWGEETAYYVNAHYMLGWSHFKQNDYPQAIASFTDALDQLMRSDNALEHMPRGEREMASDCFRVLAVTFSYLDGTRSIASTYSHLGRRSYEPLIYQSLGDLYLKQERYRDSAGAYKTFVAEHPESPEAHNFQLRVIQAYEAGGFPQQVIEEKRDYVEGFSVTSNYWRLSTPVKRLEMRPGLQQFTEELARHYHSLAQKAEDEQGREFYQLAGDYYQLYLDSFPQDEKIPEMAYLLAEARFESDDYRAAIENYEWMAYRFPEHEKAADAGYAAVVAYGQLGASEGEDLTAYTESQIRFARTFDTDPRATAVLANAANSLLAQEDYRRAARVAADLVEWLPDPGSDIVIPAWLVMGHSQFELGQYAWAEQAYMGALALMPATAERYSDTRERVAASIYRQGELAAASGRHLLAADEFNRVATVVPDARIRRSAQYDAANSYMKAGDLEAANSLLLDYRQRYPGSELTASIAATLVENYEQLGRWDAAARELDSLRATAADPESQREALYLAAQYYEKSGEPQLAIERFRSYAHAWTKPVAVRMEAMNNLSQLYSQAGDESRQAYWLRAMMAGHDEAGSQQTERSLFLAASSASELADRDFQRYLQIPLSRPLKRSLGEKRKAMDSAVAGYERVNDYGVQGLSTRATYRLGSIYQELSSALMKSERPRDIDALALEQYEMLLEEQAFPFEEKAIAIHETNARRSWKDIYDSWVQQSFAALAELMPARYGKEELWMHYPDEAMPALNSYGITLRMQGRFREAESVYLEAVALDEGRAEAHHNLGVLCELYLGEEQRALQHYQHYQALTGHESREVALWIADLERRQKRRMTGGDV